MVPRIFGSGVGDDYSVIGKRQNYKHRVMSISAACPVEWISSGRIITVTAIPEMNYTDDKESLLEPSRQLHVNTTTISMGVHSLIHISSRGYLTFQTGYSHAHPSAKTPRWGSLDLTTGSGAALKHNYEMLNSSNNCISASASWSILISRVVYTLSVAYRHIEYDRLNNNGNLVTISISASF